MRAEGLPVLQPVILSWNLRNNLDSPSSHLPGAFCIGGSGLGEYPVDCWKPFLLEIPASGTKKDIAGRTSHAFGVSLPSTQWNTRRTVLLPLFSNGDRLSLEGLKAVVRHWPDAVAEEMPCLAVAEKVTGYYGEDREVQNVAVLLIWGDGTARLVTLDWSEGSLEDCVTPEWFVQSSPLLNLRAAVGDFERVHANVSWSRPSFRIYTLPDCLGNLLEGSPSPSTYQFWRREWRYRDAPAMKTDLSRLLSEVRQIFSIEGGG